MRPFVVTSLLLMLSSFTTLRFIVKNHRRLCTSIYEKLHDTNKKYLVEFRGLLPNFRYLEFLQSVSYTLGERYANSINFEPVIRDTLSNYAMCAYVYLPNDEKATLVVKRCSLVRSIIEVWGHGENRLEVNQMALSRYDDIISPIFGIEGSREQNSWKVQFRRQGRSTNVDFEQRKALLNEFKDLLLRLNGEVSLENPKHQLIYLEDWYDYHTTHNEWAKELSLNKVVEDKSLKSPDFEYNPSLIILGRIVSEGPNIQTLYDIKYRPYLGSTTMDEVASHLAANAANLSANDIVLDPFVGTGSLLIACAGHFGAKVVGSDIDVDCLGLLQNSSSLPFHQRSKNSRFRRLPGLQSQIDLNIEANFKHYKIQDKVVAWLGIDIAEWLKDDTVCLGKLYSGKSIEADGIESPEVETVKLNTFDQFDAIVTDPPFGRREKSFGLSLDTSLGDSMSSTAYLFAVGLKKLKLYGKLVFYFPTDAESTFDEVLSNLTTIEQLGRSILKSSIEFSNTNSNGDDHNSLDNKFILESITENNLHSSLSRWLCVFRKIIP